MAHVDKEQYERGLEAFLVGRYLKENGLLRTLACFFEETPVKIVPKMEENNMLSIGGMVRELGWLSTELKEKHKRMQQYEDILNLLFQELRDVYNFGSSDNRRNHREFKSAAEDKINGKDDHPGSSNSMQYIQDDGSDTPTSEINDAERLIEEFCRQHNIYPHNGDDINGKIGPSLVPKPSRSSKDGCNFQEGKTSLTQSMDVPLSAHHDHGHSLERNECSKSKGEKRASPRPALEHYYNRIREYRRLNNRQKYRQNHALIQSSAVSTRKYNKLSDPEKKTEVRATKKAPHNCTIDWVNRHSTLEVDVIIGRPSNVCETKKENSIAEGSYRGRINDSKVVNIGESSNGVCNSVVGRSYDTDEIASSDWELVKSSASKACESRTVPEAKIPDENNPTNGSRSNLKHAQKCGLDASGHYRKMGREKFSKRRHRTIADDHQQSLDSSSVCSLPTISAKASDIVDESNTCNSSGNNVTFLATETANLLERLLPLVAHPDAMNTFIRNLHTFSLRSSPTRSKGCNVDGNHLENSIVHHLQMLENTATCDITSSDGRIKHEKAMLIDKANEENDDSEDGSILAELEEVVGKTVDAIVQRYVSSSPPA